MRLLRRDRNGVADAVQRILVGQLGDRQAGCEPAVAVAAVHRIRARAERLALAAAVGRIAGVLAVDHVGGDRQHALRMRCIAIGRVLADLLHETRDKIRGDAVHPIVVVAELRRRALLSMRIVDGKAGVVPDHVDLAVLDRRQAVGDDGQAGNAERHGAQDVAVVQRHFETFVEILVVHVMDAVHRMHIGARQPLHHAGRISRTPRRSRGPRRSQAVSPARPARPTSRRGRR